MNLVRNGVCRLLCTGKQGRLLFLTWCYRINGSYISGTIYVMLLLRGASGSAWSSWADFVLWRGPRWLYQTAPNKQHTKTNVPTIPIKTGTLLLSSSLLTTFLLSSSQAEGVGTGVGGVRVLPGVDKSAGVASLSTMGAKTWIDVYLVACATTAV